MSRRPDEDEAGAFLAYLERHAPRALTIQQVAHELGLDRYDRKSVQAALAAKAAAGVLSRVGKTRFRWDPQIGRQAERRERLRARVGRDSAADGRVEGRYARVRAGYGFVRVLGAAAARYRRDILIPSGMEGTAMDGDRVAVEIERFDPRDHRASGRVVAVLASGHERIIGTLEFHVRGWRLIPTNDLLPLIDITGVTLPNPRDDGRVAVVKLTAPSTPTRGPRGELERVLGGADDPEVQLLSIVFEFGLRVDFPDDVAAAAAALPSDPAPADFDGREDLRELPFVTIDGEDAKDFDDAVCVERRDRGYRAWVAIADVSHYVRPGSPLDDEAMRRGTSAYFPDRAIPMLPPGLSNQLCSLNPGRDRLVLVAEMGFDAQGRRHDERFYRGVIRSHARLTYTQVAATLVDSAQDEASGAAIPDPQLRARMHTLRDLMAKLYDNRLQAGSLDLDLPEPFVELNPQGRCIGLRLRERNDAHRIIEELMLEANRAVAIYLRDRDVSFPYRVHEPPDPVDLSELNESLARFGLRVAVGDPVRPRDVQKLLSELRGHRLERVLSRQLLRSLTQAQYSAINTGHFGLAFPIYCHFTSPIRRYPDLLVHRQLGRLFDGKAVPAADEIEKIEAASIASSQAERNAMEAERAMFDLKRAEFMLEHIGEAESGTVVSVASFGFFVELDRYPVEGLVRIQDVDDDFYELIEGGGAFQGVRTRRLIGVGDRVIVEATDVSVQRRQVTFGLVDHVEDETTPRRRSSPSGRRRGDHSVATPRGKRQRRR